MKGTKSWEKKLRILEKIGSTYNIQLRLNTAATPGASLDLHRHALWQRVFSAARELMPDEHNEIIGDAGYLACL